MNYVLAVKSPVYGKQGAFLAYQFAKALLEKGHAISQIFFFQDGVSNGNGLVYPANDEFNLTQAWQAFSAQHHIPLHLCVAASHVVVWWMHLRQKRQIKRILQKVLRLQA